MEQQPPAKGTVRVTVEEDPNWLSPYGAARDSHGRALYSAVVTLTLGVLGSTILPVPYAFSKMGIAVGVVTIVVVATVNVVTCCMLIRAAAYTGCYSYEQLAEWAGGKRGKVVTQVSLIFLLYGTMCGGLAFLSDVALVCVHKGLPSAPQLLQEDGRPVMVLVVLTVLLPLCMQRHIRQFEKAATVGVVVVVALSAIIIHKAVTLGFPAVRDGELPLFSLRVDRHLPEAFSVLGFAFYMQPFLLPVFKELPRGSEGVSIAEQAVHFVLYVSATLAYGTVGVFGASIYGQATESNIMVNDILTDQRATLVLYSALMVYLCCGMVNTQYALRASIDHLLMGPDAPYTASRHAAQTLCILAASVAVAAAFPREAEKIFALTGATAVCLSCYMIPVYIHLKLQARIKQAVSDCEGHCRACGYEDEGRVGVNGNGVADGIDPLATRGWHLQHEADAVGEREGRMGSHSGRVAGAQQGGEGAALRAPLLGPQRVGCGCQRCGAFPPPAKVWWAVRAVEAVKPWAVLAVGVGCSLAGLWVAATDFYNTYIHPEG